MKTVERDVHDIRQRGVDKLPQVTAETWAAALFEEYDRRRAMVQRQLDVLDPENHAARVAYLRLLQVEDRQLTLELQRLGVVAAVPQQELMMLRVMRRLQSLPIEELEELAESIGDQDAFARLWQARVQEPVSVTGGVEVHEGLPPGIEDEDDDDMPVMDD